MHFFGHLLQFVLHDSRIIKCLLVLGNVERAVKPVDEDAKGPLAPLRTVSQLSPFYQESTPLNPEIFDRPTPELMVLAMLRMNIVTLETLNRLAQDQDWLTAFGISSDKVQYLGDLWTWASNASLYDREYQEVASASSTGLSSATSDIDNNSYPRRGSLTSLASPRSTDMTMRMMTLDRTDSATSTGTSISPTHEQVSLVSITEGSAVEDAPEAKTFRVTQACDQCSSRYVSIQQANVFLEK
jgi:hypothetical protein